MISTLLALVPPSHRGRLRAHLALTVTSALLRAAAVVLLVPLLSALFGDQPTTAYPWLGAVAAATVLGWVVDAVASRLGFELGFGLLDHAQHDVAERLTRIRLAWFTSAHRSDARQAIAATGPDLVGLIVNFVTPLVGAVLLPPAIALALLAIAPPLALAALVGLPVMLGALWLGGRSTRTADAAAEEANADLTERLVEFGRTQEVLRASRRATPARSQVASALAGQHAATMRLILLQAPGQLLFGIASQIALIALAGTAAALVLRGEVSAAAGVALIVVTVRYLEPFTTIAELAPGLETVRLTLARIRAVLDAPVVPHGTDDRPVSAPPEIRLRDVQVRYALDGPAVVDGLDLTLAAGSTAAVVGPSGSGKTTLLSLIAGLVEPTRGQVLLDGRDAAELTAQARRDAVTVVFQDSYLFDGSIEDNIRVGDPCAGAERVDAVTELARVDEIVERLPDGAANPVGEAGGRLSGGERQRVSIARALVKPAPVLLVDEATSALDTENERAVVDALTRDPQPRTRVIVAHRLSSIAAADRVLFVDGGAIVEDGTVEELLARQGRFATFWAHQHAGARWRLVDSEA